MKEKYTHFEAGPWSQLDQHTFRLPGTNVTVPGKLFLKEKLSLTSCEISMNVFPPGASMPFTHRHCKNEEIYIVIKGEGEFYLDGDCLPLKEGSVLRVSPETERAWRNHTQEEWCFLCIQAKEDSFETSMVEDGQVVQPQWNWEQGE